MRIAVVACGLCIAAQPTSLVEVEAFLGRREGTGSPEGLRRASALGGGERGLRCPARVTEKSRELNDRTGECDG